MGTLNAALAWAARGFAVFPLQVNTKEPAHGTDWSDLATTDAEVLRAMWIDPVLGTERDYNIGCAATDMVIVDIDVKNGKDGFNEYRSMGGHFDTLVIETPSGGYHCYFYGPDSSNVSLSPAVDIRSHRGYVVAPGSVIDGKEYRIINERDLSWVPDTIERRLSPPHVRNDISEATAVDTDAAVQAGVRFLQSAPPAIEGQRGDETTFVTAARLVREMALSVPTAYHLMIEHWNPRCQPPWEPDELLRKIENAAAYGSADEGRLSPETLFGQIINKISPPPSVFAAISDFGNALDPADIQPRPWLIERMLMSNAVTVLLASGSAGKSSMSLALAAHLALGLDFAGYKVRRACKSIIYNGEDDVEEQSRRLLAICMAYGFDYQVVKQGILLLSARELKLQLVSKEGGRAFRNDIVVEQLTEKLRDPEVGVLILDPLVKLHACDENDNTGMDVVMETLTDIAHNSHTSIMVLHHTGKSGEVAQEKRIGNADIARGASAVVNASRVAFTLINASRQDAEDYGFGEENRHMYVRLDDAKMNLTLAGQTATWFKREGITIPSLDVVGVLTYSKLEKSREHIRSRIARALVQQLEANGQGSMDIKTAMSAVRADESLWANKTDAEMRRGLLAFFTVPYAHEGKTLTVVRSGKEDDKVTVVLT